MIGPAVGNECGVRGARDSLGRNTSRRQTGESSPRRGQKSVGLEHHGDGDRDQADDRHLQTRPTGLRRSRVRFSASGGVKPRAEYPPRRALSFPHREAAGPGQRDNRHDAARPRGDTRSVTHMMFSLVPASTTLSNHSANGRNTLLRSEPGVLEPASTHDQG
jgi:hypothetical protein